MEEQLARLTELPPSTTDQERQAESPKSDDRLDRLENQLDQLAELMFKGDELQLEYLKQKSGDTINPVPIPSPIQPTPLPQPVYSMSDQHRPYYPADLAHPTKPTPPQIGVSLSTTIPLQQHRSPSTDSALLALIKVFTDLYKKDLVLPKFNTGKTDFYQ